MNEEIIIHLMKIEKMLFMLLNEEQKKEIYQDDIDYYDSKIKLYNELLKDEKGE